MTIVDCRWRLRLQSLAAVVLTVAAAVGWSHAQESAPWAQIPAGQYRIAGTVVNAKTGGVLVRSRVTITEEKNQHSYQSVVTGGDGRFEFRVPAGKYSLRGAKRGFVAASYEQHEQFWSAIVAGAELDTESLVLRLGPDAVLSGKVLDEFGEPVRGAQIAVYREEHTQGVSRIVRYRFALADDLGRYEVTELDAGTYFVSAKAAPWYAIHPNSSEEGVSSQVDSSLDVAYPITYYGDVAEAEDAAAVPVRAGDRLEADIHMTPAAAMHLVVHSGESEGARVPVLQKPAFDGVDSVDVINSQIAPGVFELTGFAAGRYTVRVPDASGGLKEPAEVNLSSGELDIPTARSTSKITAAIAVENTTALPPGLQIGLRDGKWRTHFARVDAKGEVTFADVIPGKYEVVGFAQTQAYSVVRIGLESGAIAGHTLNVPAGVSLTVALSLAGGSTTVEGLAKRAEKAASGAMIVLVPNDPEANRDRFRRDQSNLDGSFSLTNVIPGSYTIVAIEDGWDLDWSEAAVLAQYLKHGQAVEIGDRVQSPVRLAGPVEAQSR
jgi:Carboxypeptidase regulatory-like domain